MKCLVIGKIFSQVPITLVYTWYTNTEYNKKKNKFIYSYKNIYNFMCRIYMKVELQRKNILKNYKASIHLCNYIRIHYEFYLSVGGLYFTTYQPLFNAKSSWYIYIE